MDYITKKITRKSLRAISKIFRQIFGLTENEKIPVLDILELLPSKLSGVRYEVVNDDFLPKNVPAECRITSDDDICIYIKNKVYEGAYIKGIGGYRNHIIHEVCHAFLYILGYKPIMQRSFKNGAIPPYMSVEWQAKALCGEIMMPYYETKNMTVDEIVKAYGVSVDSAKHRKKY